MTIRSTSSQLNRNIAARAAALALAGAALFSFQGVPAAAAGVHLQFEHRLSDFSGIVPSLWAKVDVDPVLGEVYALNVDEGLIQIYNETGMQVFSCGEEYSLRSATDIAVGEDGEFFVLFSRIRGREILHLDYRGSVLGRVSLGDIPKEFQPFQANYMVYRDGQLILADACELRVAVLSPEGEFLEGIDLRELVLGENEADLAQAEISEAKREQLKKDQEALAQAEVGGFGVDAEGALYFTLPTQFRAFRLNSSGELQSFGKSGGAPGKFGVVAGIEADDEGNIYIADRLKSVVLVFDRDFNFLTEVGYRGGAPHNLIVPDDIAVDVHNRKLYVSQAANLGVSVFRLQLN